MTARTGLYGNERGGTMVLVTVCLVALLGMGALAVDLSALYKLHNDAQRTADAAALAGASSFQKFKPTQPEAIDTAFVRALRYASANYVAQDSVAVGTPRYDTVTSPMVKYYATFPQGQVQIIPDSQKVRVIITRSAVNTFFAHILNIGGNSPGGLTKFDTVGVSAKAAAVAVDAGSGKCVKPFAIPDMWFDNNDDVNTNLLWDGTTGNGKNVVPGESWGFGNDGGDYYRRYQDPNTGDTRAFTGYGSSFRNSTKDPTTNKKYWDDYGRPVSIKLTNPQDNPASSFFFPWVLPGSQPGAKDYRENIWSCNPTSVQLGTDIIVDPSLVDTIDLNKPGNMVGPTNQGIDSLVALDSLACWAESPDPDHSGYTKGEVKRRAPGGTACNQAYPEWESSPRVMLAPMFDPKYITNGRTDMTFNNLALWFLEGQKNPKSPVVARFMYFAKGTGPTGPVTGSLIKKLRLVE